MLSKLRRQLKQDKRGMRQPLRQTLRLLVSRGMWVKWLNNNKQNQVERRRYQNQESTERA